MTRIATDAGDHFVDAYYTVLNGSRNTLAQYYIPSQTLPSGRTLPHISYNGEVINHADAFQEKFDKLMPWTHYEVQSLNVHVLNPCIDPDGSKTKKDAERNLSLVVQVSGFVRLVERKDGPIRGFSDNFVLVPNKEEAGGRGTGKQDHGRRWLIQTQNFRFVV